MNKYVLLILTLTFPSITMADINENLNVICGKASFDEIHSVSIGKVIGIASHRSGYLMVVNDGANDYVREYLLNAEKTAGISQGCIEYLNMNSITNVVESNSNELIARIYFDFDNAQLTEISKTILNMVASRLALTPHMIKLEGSTDNVGSINYNYVLGLKRSNTTAEYLIDKGVQTKKLIVTSVGETSPVDSNNTEFGRETNRHVDIVL